MKPRFVTFHYKMKDSGGELLESSYEKNEPMMYLEGRGHILPTLESMMLNLNVGDFKTIPVPQEDAYGVRNDKLVLRAPYSKLPKEKVAIGEKFVLTTKEFGQRIYRVTEHIPGGAVLDGNHPLAGKNLIFDIEITEAREASKADIQELSPEVETEAANESVDSGARSN